jgi:hypothetical protein
MLLDLIGRQSVSVVLRKKFVQEVLGDSVHVVSLIEKKWFLCDDGSHVVAILSIGAKSHLRFETMSVGIKGGDNINSLGL